MEKPCPSSHRLLLVLVVACLLLSRPPALGAAEPPGGAASGRVSFHGRVLDPAGVPVSGARVTAQAEVRGTTPTVTAISDADGVFSFDLPTGRYVVGVEVEGFAAVVQTVNLTPGDSAPLDLLLQGGSTSRSR